MSHAVIPAPVRFDVTGERGFVFRPGTAVTYSVPGIAPVAERFCAEATRRTGVHLAATPGEPAQGAPSVRIELGTEGELEALPAPAGISPAGDGAPDERYSLLAGADQVVLRAVTPAGLARGLTTLLQLMAVASDGGAGEVLVPGARIVDAPRYAWRGLSLDVARTWLPASEIRRVIDLLAFYKLNVLHLHLVDDQSWRLPWGRPGQVPEPDGTFYGAGELRALVAYAAERFVTVVPEVDTPGHATALMRLHPELNTGRNQVEFEMPTGRKHHAVWLDPELPATFPVLEEVLHGIAAVFPGPYIHLGTDEPYGMPRELYTSYVRRARDLVRALGRHPLGWQESARAGLAPNDIIQYWIADIGLPASYSPEVRAEIQAYRDAELARSRQDVKTALAAAVPVIVSPLSHCYLDVPYAEPPADPAQAGLHGRLGLRGVYAPKTVAESFDWEPVAALGPGGEALVAGVEAAIWTETVGDFDDLTFLLLPRLPGVAHRAWSDPRSATWTSHRDRLARHGPLWAQDGLTYFRASGVDWTGALSRRPAG